MKLIFGKNAVKMNNELTLLLVSYDGYSDMWPTFFECKEKFWSDCPYPIVLANNEKDFKAGNLEVINCGKEAQWSTRTRKALENIDTKYVMFLLEDLFISDKVKTEHIEGALDLMDKDSIDYYKIMTFTKFRTPLYKGIDHLHEIPASWPYGISLQAAIWNREYFLEMVGKEDYNPWVFEVNRLEEEENATDPQKVVGVFDDRNILNICHMVVQGKYLRGAVSRMEKVGVKIDTAARGLMPWKDNLIYSIKEIVVPFTDRHPRIRNFLRAIGPESVAGKIQRKTKN